VLIHRGIRANNTLLGAFFVFSGAKMNLNKIKKPKIKIKIYFLSEKVCLDLFQELKSELDSPYRCSPSKTRGRDAGRGNFLGHATCSIKTNKRVCNY
jgi:hypothetical protein